MAVSPYIAGVLDALVKSGEVSRPYADGVSDALEKQAFFGFWYDPHTNLRNEYNSFVDAHGRRPGTEEMNDIVDSSRHWWDDWNYAKRAWNYTKNRASKYLNYLDPTQAQRPAESYDQEWKNWRDMDREAYKRRMLDTSRNQDMYRDLAAQSDAANGARAQFTAGTANYMPQYERDARGYTNQKNIEFGPMTKSMFKSKAVKQQNNYDPQLGSQFGKGMPKSYGGNSELFVRRGI